MKLKQIEIAGFKSFADKVTMEFSDGITAVVGSNGSGKSNIADAVRWVLGEQNARALRGEKMGDIIFNGTEKRRATSLAEVTLIFDNEDNALQINTPEVSVTRRIYRSGESGYLINNTTCRMRDIQALFYDTGVGREGYSIIGQGRIEDILSNRGDERRVAIEEAAGIMKYKVRREDARRKLDKVGMDIVRAGDILNELEVSLEPLKKQSEEAERFIQLQDRLKTLEINLFLVQYEQNRAKHKSLQATLSQLSKDETELALRQAEYQERIEFVEKELAEKEREAELAREENMAHSMGLLDAQNNCRLLEQEVQHLKEEETRLQAELQDNTQRLAQTKALLLADAPAEEDELDRLALEIEQMSKVLESEALKISGLEETLDERRQLLMSSLEKEGDRRARLAHFEALLAQIEDRYAEITRLYDQTEVEKQQIADEVMGVERELAAIEEECKSAQTKIGQARAKETAAEQESARAREEADRVREQLRNAAQKLELQNQLLKDYEGYANGVRLLMRDVHRGHCDGAGVLGTVAELMVVPPSYETAIEQVLGGALQNLVVDNQQTAKRLIAYLRKQEYGRATFLPQDALQIRRFNERELKELAQSGMIGVAEALIGFDKTVAPAMGFLLGRTVIVQDMDAGIALTRACRFNFRCVTLQGDILQSSGVITGGTVRQQNLVSRERIVQETKAQVQQFTEKKQMLEQAFVKTIEALEQAKKETEAVRQAENDAKARFAVISERLESTRAAGQREEERLVQFLLELERLEQMRTDIISEQTEEFSAAPEDEQLLRAEIKEKQDELFALRNEQDARSKKLQELSASYAAGKTERSAWMREQSRLTAEEAQLSKSIAQLSEASLELSGKLETAQESLLSTSERVAALGQTGSNLNAMLEVLDQRLKQLEEEKRTAHAQMEKSRQDALTLVDKKYRSQAQIERLEADFEHMQTRIWEHYEMTIKTAQAYRTEIVPEEANAETDRIRAAMRRMNAINPGAIAEYRRVRDRYDYLAGQKEDLLTAQAEITQAIDELTEQMQKQFMEQFDLVNAHFSRVFAQLFGGGTARLQLQDKENPLECTIDIVAQPPGKNLRLISLLSGGEKALTAIAIMFALLEVRATPFCILDEIETALDEENQYRFAQFLREYTDNTQFVVITHRRPTMEAAERMYGVSMEEKGVSKIVGVKFS
ncbi:MAG: chromosome segregation protein SMC [Clostridia bacterium]|nr:chromosome segregation protein SMC [Clostridia bacterium]